jgi:hypothetical protein
MIEFGTQGSQTGFDVAQALAIGQLREGHAEKLVETGERSYAMIASMAFDATPELVLGQEVHELSEDGLSGVHEPLPSTPLGEKNGRSLGAS